jgi:hypothetical protein
LNGLECG